MTVRVQIKYATMPNATPSSCTSVTLSTSDTSYSALKEMIQAQHPGWYNIQIISVN